MDLYGKVCLIVVLCIVAGVALLCLRCLLEHYCGCCQPPQPPPPSSPTPQEIEFARPVHSTSVEQRIAELALAAAREIESVGGASHVGIPQLCHPHFVTAPMAGTVNEVYVAPSLAINENDIILTIQPSVGENTVDVLTTIGGRVSEVPVAAGRRVAADAYIAAIETV